MKAIRVIAKLFLKKGNKQVSAFFEKLEEFFKKFKEYLKKKEKSPDSDDLLPDDKDKLTEKNKEKVSDKDDFPEKDEKKTSDVDETKESDKLDESSLDKVDNIEILNEIDRIKGLSKEERINELGLDPIKNKVDAYEGEIGQFAESSYGYFKRYTASAEGDFISMSGECSLRVVHTKAKFLIHSVCFSTLQRIILIPICLDFFHQSRNIFSINQM